MKKLIHMMSIVSLSVLSACSLNPHNPGKTAGSAMNAFLDNAIKSNEAIAHGKTQNMPLQVRNALIPGFKLKNNEIAVSDTKHFDVVVHNVPAQSFFVGLVKDTPYNIVVSPKVSGKISLNLKDVTVQQVLDAIHDLYGYQYTFTPYSIQVHPPGLQTRMFKVNYLDISRAGSSSTQIETGDIAAENQEQADTESQSITQAASAQKSLGGIHQNSALSNRAGAENLTPDKAMASNVQTHVQTDFWRTLSRTLEVIVGNKNGHQVVINSSAGIVIVKASPEEVKEVSHYLDSLQSAMTREVIIDAKILEITLSKGYQAGVNWNILGVNINGLGSNFGSTSDLGPFTNVVSFSTTKNFTSAINLLSTQGNVQVLSSPRVATLNNQKAIIKVGTEQFYVTNVSSSTQSVDNPETTQNVDFSPFFSGIALGVTPEIGANGDITLHVHPLVSTVTSAETKFTVNGKEDKVDMAKSQIRESDNIVTAKTGQIVVLGGLMENKTDEDLGGAPFISKIPFVGSLFRRTMQSATKTELVILLKPTVINNNTLVSELQDIKRQTLTNEKGYHFGAFPGRFGNSAELAYFHQFNGKGGNT